MMCSMETDCSTSTYCGGIAWASGHHDVCVLDAATRRRLAEFRVAHPAGGLAELRARLARFGDPAMLPLALERPSGLLVDALLVDALLEAGHPVVPVHPGRMPCIAGRPAHALKATRARYTSAGAKSDAADADIAADLLRTDGHRVARLQAPSDATRAWHSPTSSARCSRVRGPAPPSSSPRSTARYADVGDDLPDA
jgi:hypothetical protein